MNPGWSNFIEEMLCDQGIGLCVFVCAYISVCSTSNGIKVKKDI